MVEAYREGTLRESDDARVLRTTAVQRFLAASNELAVLPASATKLVAMSNDPHTGLLEIAAVARTDPAVASRIVSLANSAAYAPRASARLSSLEKSIQRVGTTALRALVLQIAMHSRLLRLRGYEDVVQGLARHAIYSAVAARSICRCLGLDPELGFLMGLLHDIGKSIAIEAYCRSDPDLRASLAPSKEALMVLLHATHEEIGAYAARRWELAEEVCKALGAHEVQGAMQRNLRFAAIISTGDGIAHQVEEGPSTERGDIREKPTPFELGLTPRDLEKLLKCVPEEAASLLSILS